MISAFREVMYDCDLNDLGCKGYPFTWGNGRFGKDCVEERLDRFLCNKEWRDRFDDCAAINLETWTSDHCPILMKVEEKGSGLTSMRKSAPRIHYEEMWSSYEGCKGIIEREWGSQGQWSCSNPVQTFKRVTKSSMAQLKCWSRQEFGGRQKKLEELVGKLENLRLSGMQYRDGVEIKQVKTQIHNMLLDEEVYWKQRSRVEWLKEGDQNTKLFHTKASSRRRKNKIWGIEDSQGNWLEKGDEVEREFCGYFSNLFSSSGPNQKQVETVLEGMIPKVSKEMNDRLLQPFTREEITEALNQMCPTKAPRSDGLPPVFNQKHWNAVNTGVVTTCLHILNGQEAFSNMLQRAEERGLIHGLKFSRDITISHLLFADDSLIFTRASEEDCLHLKKIFAEYAAASGQLFNYDKSSMFFSGNTSNGVMSAIKNIFQLNVVSRHEKYLGLPSMVGRKKLGFFNDIKLKVTSKIASWHHKFFSCGGKEVLIKAVAQAVPAYAMSVFKLPLGICNDIQQAVARFWWSSDMEKRGIHWAKWESLSQAKQRGGLGFRDFQSFNQALVAKQRWRILQFPDSLMAKVLKARYFKSDQFLNAKLGTKPSFIWRSILWGRQVIHKGIRWRIGNGRQVQIYKGNWIPRPMLFKLVSPPSLPNDVMVSKLIDDDNQWNEAQINQHFVKEDADMILWIPLPRQPMNDQVLWHYDRKGIYSVKSGYQVTLKIKFPDVPSCSEWKANQWSLIWSMALPERIKIFMWRAAKNILPTAENLWKKKILPHPLCQICGSGMETSVHALVECNSARKIWKITQFVNELRTTAEHDILSMVHDLARRIGKREMELVVALAWVAWGSRNQALFKGKRENPCISVARAEAVVDSFKKIQLPESICEAGQKQNPQICWNPPPPNWLKVNVDDAVSLEKQQAGLGVMIRDANKNFVAAAIKSTKLYCDVAYAEAEALSWGLELAAYARLANVIVESDSQVAIDFVNNRKSSRIEIQCVIADVQNKMKDFIGLKAEHVPRSYNAIVHSLAKLALKKC